MHNRTRLTDLIGASLDEIHIDANNPSMIVFLTADGAILFQIPIDYFYDKHGNRFNLINIPTQFVPDQD